MPHRFENIFPRRPVPQWLSKIGNLKKLPNPIPLKEVLTDSCYYPSSGLDASPIIILNGFVHSFVLVDYSVDRERYLEEISTFKFKGYDQILARDIEKEEIVPPYMIPHLTESRSKVQSMGFWGQIHLAEPFCHWSIWQRWEGRDDSHGPEFFSLLYIAGEGVATCEGLYNYHKITPQACALIQPGYGPFGNNWAEFFDPEGQFWKTVTSLGEKPEYLLMNYWEKRVCLFDGYQHIHRADTCQGGKLLVEKQDGDQLNRKWVPDWSDQIFPLRYDFSGEERKALENEGVVEIRHPEVRVVDIFKRESL